MHATPAPGGSGEAALAAVVLAFPVAMALATGVEAPLTAIAQLGQLGDGDRRRFGRGTLALTIAIVGSLTLSLTALAVHLGVGIPQPEIHDDRGRGARRRRRRRHLRALPGDQRRAVLAVPPVLCGRARSAARRSPVGREIRSGSCLVSSVAPMPTTRPYWSVLVFFVASAVVVVAAGGHEQELVLFYAVAVFVSFLTGLLAMARFSLNEHKLVLLAVNGVAVARGRLHDRRQSRARLSRRLTRRRGSHRYRPLRALGASRSTEWHRRGRGDDRALSAQPGTGTRVARGPAPGRPGTQ